MTTKLVPDEIYMKHENEWQALRQIADSTAGSADDRHALGVVFP
jgi:hypothetical protein